MRFIYIGAFRMPNLDAAAPRVLTIGKMLRERGHSVKYISWGGAYDEGHKQGDKYLVDGFEYTISNELKKYRNPVSRFLQWINRGKNSLKSLQFSDKYDVVIAYQPSLFFLEQLKKICRKKGKTLIVDITEWYDNNELRLLDRPIQYYNMTRALKDVKNKILISESLNEYYQNSHNVVIPATCDRSESKWNDEPRSFLPSFEGITLIYAGTPALKDKLSVAVKAVSSLIKQGENLRFVIFGVTRDQYLSHYPSELPQQIVFMGRVSQDDIPGFYRQSDFMLLLRDKTRKNMMGFPTKFAEAITAGIPIITNNTSDLAKFLNHGENGFFIEEPSEECLYAFLKDHICRLTPQHIKGLKENAKSKSGQLDYHEFLDLIDSFTKSL